MCIPKREIFINPVSGYRVIGCEPVEHCSNLELNDYDNFTLAGSNLLSIKLKEKIKLNIRKDKNAKRPGSYILIGYSGIEYNGEISVDREQEYPILCQLMEPSQARHVLDAYPDFVQMVLKGEEEQIDYKKIYNVGKVRYEIYVDKVKKSCREILFMPVALKYGIEDQGQINALAKKFLSPEDLEEAFENNPYKIYMDVEHWSFNKADYKVRTLLPQFIDSKIRCLYACIDLMNDIQNNGDTRAYDDIFMEVINERVPECSYHIKDVFNDEDNIMYWDSVNGYVSNSNIMEAEKNIADNILYRLNNHQNCYEYDEVEGVSFKPAEKVHWSDFKVVDGFEMTDEQSKILELAYNNSICMLTGSAGSGKSTSMKALIQMLESLGKNYLLLAPTGIAAKRLRESTGRKASTIRMYLNKKGQDIYDYVIIDECSMIDVELLSDLFSSIGKAPNIVMVCDESQLSSISCGNIVQDMLNSGIVPRANLTKVFRYGTGGIATIATDARFGKFTNYSQSYPDFCFNQIQDDPINQVLQEYQKYIDMGYTKNDILVLTPFNVGKNGTYVLNDYLQMRYNNHINTDAKITINKHTINFKIGDKVLNTHNNYNVIKMDYTEDGGLEIIEDAKIAVMNGDIGYVLGSRYDENGLLCLAVQWENDIGLMVGNEIARLLLGYAITIHKVQGSQAKVVIVLLPEAKTDFITRNLVYVAFSRAQEQMSVIGNVDVINRALSVQTNMERNTWLEDMLNE